MVHKIFQYFNQCTDILKGFLDVGIGHYIYFWKSKGLSVENIITPTTSDYSLTPHLSYIGTKTRLEFRRSCLRKDQITLNHGILVNIYIVYELDKIYVVSPTLVNCLFGIASLTKNADIDQYKYSGYRIGFDRGNGYSVANGFVEM